MSNQPTTIRDFLHGILASVPAEKLDMQSPGFVFIAALAEGPVSLSNLPPELSQQLVKLAGKGDVENTEHFKVESYQQH